MTGRTRAGGVKIAVNGLGRGSGAWLGNAMAGSR